jgi:hypothetical protein
MIINRDRLIVISIIVFELFLGMALYAFSLSTLRPHTIYYEVSVEKISVRHADNYMLVNITLKNTGLGKVILLNVSALNGEYNINHVLHPGESITLSIKVDRDIDNITIWYLGYYDRKLYRLIIHSLDKAYK